MKALIIGGTKGFGQEILEQLLDKKYEPITVSRSKTGYKNYLHYSCDVGNLEQWAKTLGKIVDQQKSLDFLACIAGFAVAKPFEDLTSDNWNQHFSKNVTYVALAFQKLGDLLRSSNSPKVLTIGSQWSYKTGNNKLVPYIVAKHALRTLTEDFASRNSTFHSNHFCAPTMDTPGYWEVRKSFQAIGEETSIAGFTPEGLADSKIIAKSIIEKALETDITGCTFVVKPDGVIEVL